VQNFEDKSEKSIKIHSIEYVLKIVLCIVKYCKNTRETCVTKQVSFFQLPENTIMREGWIKKIGEIHLLTNIQRKEFIICKKSQRHCKQLLASLATARRVSPTQASQRLTEVILSCRARWYGDLL